MTNAIWFENVPLWAVYACSVVTVLLGIVTGYALGVWRRKKANEALSGPAGSVVIAMLGLLAFVLTFTFDMAASRYYARRQILLNEVNAVETAFLRSDLIGEPQRTQCRKLLKQYVDLRASLATESAAIREVAVESEKLQNLLWRQASGLVQSGISPVISALFIDSLNRLIDLQTQHVTTSLQYHVPIQIWESLFVLTFFAMTAVGYQFGISGTSSFFIYCILAAAFSLIILMIADLDSVTSGSLNVSDQPMVELQQRLNVRSAEKAEHEPVEDAPQGFRH